MQSGVVQGGIRFYEPSTHLWKALRSDYIDWRYFPVDVGNDTILMDYNMDKNMDEYKEFFRSQVHCRTTQLHSWTPSRDTCAHMPQTFLSTTVPILLASRT
jgi:hypothetical protein